MMKKISFREVFQVRRLLVPSDFAHLGTVDLVKSSEFICNEITMDRAMAVADEWAKHNALCVIIPMTLAHIEK